MNKRKTFRLIILMAIPIFVIGILGFEYIWRSQVVGGPQALSIVSDIRRNDVVRRIVGDVISADFLRTGSKADFGLFGSEDRGRYRYLVKGSKTSLDIIVTWHAQSRSSEVVVDKIESIKDWQKETIWTCGASTGAGRN